MISESFFAIMNGGPATSPDDIEPVVVSGLVSVTFPRKRPGDRLVNRWRLPKTVSSIPLRRPLAPRPHQREIQTQAYRFGTQSFGQQGVALQL